MRWPLKNYFIDDKPDLNDEFDEPKRWLNYIFAPFLIGSICVALEWLMRRIDEVYSETKAVEESRRPKP